MLHQERKKPSLLSGVLILSVASLAVKMIGLLFKVPLSHLLGDEGMGYFNSAYTIYGWLYVLATSGLPVALSILISDAAERKEEDRVRKIFRIAMLTLFFVGALGSLTMLLFSGSLANLIGSKDSRAAIFSIAPTILFVAISGGIRGYFQGRRQMLPTALSQLFEALGKLTLGMLFGGLAAKRGAPTYLVAAYAILGVTLGTFLGMLYLIVSVSFEKRAGRYMREIRREIESGGELRSLLRIAMPITLGASLSSLTNVIDLTFILNLLPKAGYSVKEATALFGNYSTLVVPVAHVPTILISPIASSLVPYLSAELAKGNKRRAAELSETALRFASIITLPAMIVLALFGERLLSLIFDERSATVAAPILAALAPSIFFFGLCNVTSAILEANGRCAFTLRSTAIGGVVKIAVGFFLIGNPNFGIFGAAIGSVACYAVIGVLNLLEVSGKVGRMSSLLDFFGRPFAAAALSGFAAVLFLRLLSIRVYGTALTLSGVAFFGIVYIVLLSLFRAVLPCDLAHLPFVSRFISLKKSKD